MHGMDNFKIMCQDSFIATPIIKKDLYSVLHINLSPLWESILECNKYCVLLHCTLNASILEFLQHLHFIQVDI